MPTAPDPTPTPRVMPKLHQLRLDMVALVYAAAVGYGFAVFDTPSAPWTAQLASWTNLAATLWNYWPSLILFLFVFAIITFDWLFIRRVYFTEGNYRKIDFVLDILIVFFFVRMMHAAIATIPKGGTDAEFGYWWWLGLVFAAYLVWDWSRVYSSYKQLLAEHPIGSVPLTGGKRAAMFRSAVLTQEWNLLPDLIFLVFLVLIYCVVSFNQGWLIFFSITHGWGLGVVTLLTMLGYAGCAYCWWWALPKTAPPPATGELPQIDKLRLNMIDFVYAAAVGYGFSVLDSAPWSFEPGKWNYVTVGLRAYWPGLLLYLFVFLMIGLDWIAIHHVYESNEKAYGGADFVVDLLVVFCFVRMFHDGANAIDQTGAVIEVSYWWWLVGVFGLYLCWDLVRAWRGHNAFTGSEETSCNQVPKPRWTLTAHVAGLVCLVVASVFADALKDGIGLVLLVVGPFALLVFCARMRLRDP